MYIGYMFCFPCSEQCINMHFVAQKVWLLCNVFKKIILNKTTPTFQEVGGVTQPLIFVDVI